MFFSLNIIMIEFDVKIENGPNFLAFHITDSLYARRFNGIFFQTNVFSAEAGT